MKNRSSHCAHIADQLHFGRITDNSDVTRLRKGCRQTGSDFLRMVLRRPKHAFGNNFAERREQRAQTSLRQPTFQSLIRSMVVGADGILGIYKKHFQYLRLQCNIFQVKTNHTTPIAAMPIRVSPIRLHSQRSDCRHDRNAFQIATTVPSTPTPPINWIRRNQML